MFLVRLAKNKMRKNGIRMHKITEKKMWLHEAENTLLHIDTSVRNYSTE